MVHLTETAVGESNISDDFPHDQKYQKFCTTQRFLIWSWVIITDQIISLYQNMTFSKGIDEFRSKTERRRKIISSYINLDLSLQFLHFGEIFFLTSDTSFYVMIKIL